MIELFSLEFWIAILFIINFILVFLLFTVAKKINRMNLRDPDQNDSREDGVNVSKTGIDIIEMLEPLVLESQKAALSFDKQIKEKKRLLKELNDALDSRIISINLLLSRADALQNKLEQRQKKICQPSPLPGDKNYKSSSDAVMDQQNQIIKMYHQQFDIDTISQRLLIPKGEVQLVIDLKKKFVAMEKNSQ